MTTQTRSSRLSATRAPPWPAFRPCSRAARPAHACASATPTRRRRAPTRRPSSSPNGRRVHAGPLPRAGVPLRPGRQRPNARSSSSRSAGSTSPLTGTVTFTTHMRPLSLVALPYLAETYEQGWRLYDTRPSSRRRRMPGRQGPHARDRQLGGGLPHPSRRHSRSARRPTCAARRSASPRSRWCAGSWRRWASTPIVMPVTEVYLAIQQGTVARSGEPDRHDLLAALLRGRASTSPCPSTSTRPAGSRLPSAPGKRSRRRTGRR